MTTKIPNPMDIISVAQDTFVSIISTVAWGKATKLSYVDLRTITTWFSKQMNSHSRSKYGVLFAKVDPSLENPRIYQAVFDSKWKCIVARQIIPNALDPQVASMLEAEDFIIFEPAQTDRKK